MRSPARAGERAGLWDACFPVRNMKETQQRIALGTAYRGDLRAVSLARLLVPGIGQWTKRDLPLRSGPGTGPAFWKPPRGALRLGGDARPALHSSMLLRGSKDLTLLCLPKGKKDTSVLSNKVIRNDGHSCTAFVTMGRTSPTPPGSQSSLHFPHAAAHHPFCTHH